ncbi:MAG: hypothetical protein CMO55_06975 [Verrucomicrobiales bacterium]|nr:hypothetical protein [Verrucomicrobiales bacterium]
MTPPKHTGGLARIREALRKSKIDDVVGAILAETPLGKAGKVLKELSDILGTSPNEDSIAEAIEAGVSPEQAIRLREFATREFEAREETARNQEDNLTSRHASDMMSDSKLSKTVRPLVTYVLLGAVIVDNLSVRVLEARGLTSTPSDVLAVLMQMAIGFYFGSRGVQHVTAQLTTKWNGRIKG